MSNLKTMMNDKPLLAALTGAKTDRIPFWLMRQAGRYLPEYRALRAEAGGFLDLVFDSERAAEVTLQPLRRYGMDAAILFSDILVVPKFLGQDVRFEAGEGPRLAPISKPSDLAALSVENVGSHAEPVFDTVRLCRLKMTGEGFDKTALIGFCGSPWTVACYMVEGRGSRDFETVRRMALCDPAFFQEIINLLVDASCRYLAGQIEAGAEAIQLFDSWSGVLDAEQFSKWVIEPTKQIVKFLKANYPSVPVIGFPRGAGAMSVLYAQETGIGCIGIDQTIDPLWAAENLQPLVTVQGNLDPVRLLAGGKALEDGMESIHRSLSPGPFIFNLGHGVIKETDPLHVERCASIVRSWKRK